MRLIDADDLKNKFAESSLYDGDEVLDIIDSAPTVERPQGEIIKELWNCRNELCLICLKYERYKEAWNGACNDCRYNFENMEKWKEGSDEVADDKHL